MENVQLRARHTSTALVVFSISTGGKQFLRETNMQLRRLQWGGSNNTIRDVHRNAVLPGIQHQTLRARRRSFSDHLRVIPQAGTCKARHNGTSSRSRKTDAAAS